MRCRALIASFLPFAACLALWAFAVATASAADYPTRFVTIIVPFPPGGTIDAQARAIAAEMSESFKQPVVVENRPGAGATIGAAYVAKSAPDGYTLLLTLQSLAISPSVYAKLPFDPVKDLEPVSLVESTFWVFCASPSFSARTFKDFIAAAKARPRALNYASTGIGTDNHITMEQLQKAAGIQVTHIPFNGAGPAMNAMVGGQVDVMLVPGAVALPYIKAGKLTPMAVLGATRSPALPDVPTLAEEGLPG
ncbi:MAG TPA: tripartite tricarboxylate transporter substrate-binding protein, partial [Casimicrobiaceae bacterium]|nr:tripartite tricarboxylate transporter substrate-binding protein [Casimicrobiaceae bacterium]